MLSLYLCSFVHVFVFRCILLVAAVYPPLMSCWHKGCATDPTPPNPVITYWPHPRTLSSLTSYKITPLTSHHQHTFQECCWDAKSNSNSTYMQIWPKSTFWWKILPAPPFHSCVILFPAADLDTRLVINFQQKQWRQTGGGKTSQFSDLPGSSL